MAEVRLRNVVKSYGSFVAVVLQYLYTVHFLALFLEVCLDRRFEFSN